MHSSAESTPLKYQTAIQGFWAAHSQDPSFMESLQLVVREHPALQYGEYHWRTISGNGTDFGLHDIVEDFTYVIAWSRIFEAKEIVCALNLHQEEQAVVYVTIDKDAQAFNSKLNRLYGPHTVPAELNVEDRNGKAVRLTIPPGSLVIYG
ncbi:hypothetical protein [Dyadobacter sp. CY323]|uniref:hypothetical protein n=1 Tax=Dyadobacter sp. CY323 TaxID=2907302 RepID=UPI001F15BF7D|nr:hypothetical protein [Dyadobacter sp. CY323]MCE6992494.1 hypothetical protein [Dyadobacter sp. CY323]